MAEAPPRVSGETHFFRDRGQFDLLRLRLLPELIERRGAARTLRLWSAGCSSGEEAYSLAMLVDALLRRREEWDVLILASDIDEAALAKAARGRYGPWSFRTAPKELRQCYFRRRGDEWELDDRIRTMVSLRRLDLVRDSFPGGDLRDMDLILCRNVFIYFDAATVAAVAAKLADSLCEGGYLMTAHTELSGYHLPQLQSRLFAESVVHQRVVAVAARPVMPTVSSSPRPALPAAAPTQPTPVAPLADAAQLLAQARQLADRGDYGGAAAGCRGALAADPLAAGPHFLLAQLAQLGGDFDGAERLLEKTLYLDPASIAAYLELAALCERAGNAARADTLRRTALALVRALPDDAPVEPYGAAAAEMARWLAQ